MSWNFDGKDAANQIQIRKNIRLNDDVSEIQRADPVNFRIVEILSVVLLMRQGIVSGFHARPSTEALDPKLLAFVHVGGSEPKTEPVLIEKIFTRFARHSLGT